MSGPISLTFYFPVAPTRGLAQVMRNLVDGFTSAHPDVAVDLTFPGGYRETLRRILSLAAAGEAPDLAVLYAGLAGTLCHADAIVPLDDYVTAAGGQDFLDDFFPVFLSTVRWRGKIWALPFQRGNMVLFWNRQHFQESGLDPDRPPQTWEALGQIAGRLVVREGRVVRRWGVELPDTGLPMIFQGFIIQQAAEFCSPDGTAVYWDSPAATRALRVLASLAQQQGVMPSDLIEWYEVVEDFLQGRTAMMIHSTSSLAHVRAKATFPFGVSFLPHGGTPGVTVGGGDLYMMKGNPPERHEAIWSLMTWLVAPQQQAQFSIASGYIAVRPSAWASEPLLSYVQAFPWARAPVDQLAYGRPELMTYAVEEVRTVMRRAIVEAIGGRPVDEALCEAQQTADAILAPHRLRESRLT